jgi:hypothetical protein
VSVTKEPTISIGDAMSGIRSWLDHRQIQLVSFELKPKVDGKIRFDLGFNTEFEAILFRQTFVVANDEPVPDAPSSVSVFGEPRRLRASRTAPAQPESDARPRRYRTAG